MMTIHVFIRKEVIKINFIYFYYNTFKNYLYILMSINDNMIIL